MIYGKLLLTFLGFFHIIILLLVFLFFIILTVNVFFLCGSFLLPLSTLVVIVVRFINFQTGKRLGFLFMLADWLASLDLTHRQTTTTTTTANTHFHVQTHTHTHSHTPNIMFLCLFLRLYSCDQHQWIWRKIVFHILLFSNTCVEKRAKKGWSLLYEQNNF